MLVRQNIGMRTLLLIALLAGVAYAQTQEFAMRFSMISLGVTNMDRSVEFYRDTLGMELTGGIGEVTMVRAGDLTIALNLPLAQSVGAQIVGAVEVIFNVDSVVDSHANLTLRGCNFVNAPREIFAGTYATTFIDPDGHRLTIMGLR